MHIPYHMRIPANALSRALVGCLTACAYAWHQRSLLRAERRALGELNEELLCEARLLAFELNKGASGDPLAVVQDPCLPTSTPERAFADDRARRTRGAGPSASRQTGSCPGPSADTAGARGSRSTLLVAGAALWCRALPPHSRLAVRPNAIRRLLGSDGGTLRTQVIGVCGMSCSGKSTVSSVLRAMAAQHGAYVPVLCLDDSYHEWMYEPPSREQPSGLVPPAGRGRRTWKNWESAR